MVELSLYQFDLSLHCFRPQLTTYYLQNGIHYTESNVRRLGVEPMCKRSGPSPIRCRLLCFQVS